VAVLAGLAHHRDDLLEPRRVGRIAHPLVVRGTPAKLVSYALDRSHERGRPKARVFASALSIRASDWGPPTVHLLPCRLTRAEARRVGQHRL
jgi:hypothetical protein